MASATASRAAVAEAVVVVVAAVVALVTAAVRWLTVMPRVVATERLARESPAGTNATTLSRHPAKAVTSTASMVANTSATAMTKLTHMRSTRTRSRTRRPASRRPRLSTARHASVRMNLARVRAHREAKSGVHLRNPTARRSLVGRKSTANRMNRRHLASRMRLGVAMSRANHSSGLSNTSRPSRVSHHLRANGLPSGRPRRMTSELHPPRPRRRRIGRRSPM